MTAINIEEEMCELMNWLVHASCKATIAGVYVDSKLRKRFLIERQNMITRDGKVMRPIWENVGGSVYRCSLKY